MNVGKGERRWEADGAAVVLEQPARGVLVFRMSGRMMPGLVEHFRGAVAPFVAANERVDLFFDTLKMSGYHPQFRDRMTEWHRDIKPHTRSAHVYVSSKLIGMAIAIANMVTGGILKSHTDRNAFERAISAAVRQTAA